MMHYETFTTNDQCEIAYQTSIALKPTARPTDSRTEDDTPANPPNPQSQSQSTAILLLHGFSGSSSYFTRNMPDLTQYHWIVAPDMRGHGRSQHTRHGYHVARLAQDLHELISSVMQAHDRTVQIYAVGCSIGAAVLWTYVELYTDGAFAGLVFVDQAPLQDRSVFDNWGVGLAHYGCYDETTTAKAQRAWAHEDPGVRDQAYVGLVASCLGYRYAPAAEDEGKVSDDQRRADEEFFVEISRQCDSTWCARLLADHTRYDHREAIEMISKPVLVMAGRRSGCFSIEGMMETVRRAQMNKSRGAAEAQAVVFGSGHWLFWEEARRFNMELLDFVERCQTSGRG